MAVRHRSHDPRWPVGPWARPLCLSGPQCNRALRFSAVSSCLWKRCLACMCIPLPMSVCVCVCVCTHQHKPTDCKNKIISTVSKVQREALNHSRCVCRYEDSEDEMEPEIEEAFENFCLESERKRQQWRQSVNLWDSAADTQTLPGGLSSGASRVR